MASFSATKIDSFFKGKPTISKLECDGVAGGIVGDDTVVSACEEQGSLSYTVSCTTKTIVSFRRRGTAIDSRVVKLSKDIHGRLVPSAFYCGTVGQGEDTLMIYKMTYLPGQSWAKLRPSRPYLNGYEQLKLATMYRDMGRYFARAYMNPLSKSSGWEAKSLMETSDYEDDRAQIQKRLTILEECGKYPYLAGFFQEAEASLPKLFADSYPKVLTHGDLSWRNFLLDEKTYRISGIIDWSLASIRPFGMDLKALLLLQFFDVDDNGVTFYQGHENLREIFWDEFWKVTGIEEEKQKDVRRLAELAGKLKYIIDLAFQRDNGKIIDVLGPFNDDCIEGYFGDAKKEADTVQADRNSLEDSVQHMPVGVGDS
ncbi:hypothetical protein F5Y18DRAFT_436795 [Xylariaceae sp. FL1019]|nr:hypothetical protein F5Y18DRAFT_436795 [Xylariaceae sp. FL1019]